VKDASRFRLFQEKKVNRTFCIGARSARRCSFHDPGGTAAAQQREEEEERCKTNFSFYIRRARLVFARRESQLLLLFQMCRQGDKREERGGGLPRRKFADASCIYRSGEIRAKIENRRENASPPAGTGSARLDNVAHRENSRRN